jgi:integrative and conjugative element protein (TIGR02256 family)
MRLEVPKKIVKQLKRELRRAGSREIGGLLLGECIGPEVFRIVEITVQRAGGSHSCFLRQPKNHQAKLDEFFVRTGNDYSRFNYLGEWHSHPSFEALPSTTDIHTMQSIVNDPVVGANFLVLLITKLSGADVEVSGTVFRPNVPAVIIEVSVESPTNVPKTSWLVGALQRYFWRLER